MGDLRTTDAARTRAADDLGGLAVCLVGINYWPETTGIAPYTTAMAEALTDAGATVHVITGIPHYPQWKLQDARYERGRRWEEMRDGVRIIRVRHAIPETPDLVGRAKLEASFLQGALREVRRDRSDIVIAVTPSLAGLAAGALGHGRRPFGVLVQDLTGNAAGESGTTGGRASRLIASGEYALLRRADRIGVITPRFGDLLIQQGVADEGIVSLPNFTHITPVDVSTAAARTRLGWTRDAFTVVHTGNMGMKQGLDSVVEAARLSDARDLGIEFVLVGDGNQRAALEEQGAGIRSLRFVPPLDGDDYPYALAAADALLLNEKPGVREMSMPSKLTSYTSSRRPIIAAVEDGGITEGVVREHGAAAIIPPGDPERLIQAAQDLRCDAAQAADLTSAAQRMFQNRYSPVSAHARYVRFAQQLAGLRSGVSA
ncbi:glycosyltransferase family 4 protein [Clavibacter michiganensis]|uniref:glycosyltransferase family 4 protein n=1 Tax=Clavibacter michiganensis TaxID=28447 RepID=UPI001BDFBB66|nr:glycosyltransferase family 4 protein [Clavibacter michiganensis]MBT1637051.1 glycosyltransferase family 4 protein [Clavibacter michiganensis]